MNVHRYGSSPACAPEFGTGVNAKEQPSNTASANPQPGDGPTPSTEEHGVRPASPPIVVRYPVPHRSSP
jgi:hypothetical protein